ncbi:hypothetical protein CGRA01v4_02181 [Colletotrichum graminicola]|nr:hypothetical protein CGRA01v4_02181 [Colletotrichum graminicola]
MRTDGRTERTRRRSRSPQATALSLSFIKTVAQKWYARCLCLCKGKDAKKNIR